jgi:DNA-binding transcriptional MocR family regulator
MRKIQPVSFSLSDPFEQALYKFAVDNGAFSKYVKRLIQRDMERRERVIQTKKTPAQSLSMTQLNGIVL